MLKKTLALIGLLISTSWANAATYEYHADQFSVDGSVEEFDSSNNSFLPWLGGAVTYENGYAVFTDPGYHLQIAGSSSYFEYSGIRYIVPESGSSAFEAQSIWSSEYLSELPGGMFGQYFFSSNNEAVAITINNFSDGIDGLLGSVEGLAAGFWLIKDTGEAVVLDRQTIAINPADITDDIIFRLAFDAGLQEITGEYSLNGGTSFDSSFGGYASTGVGTHVLFGSSVLPSEVPIPAAAWLFGSALLGLGMVKRRKT